MECSSSFNEKSLPNALSEEEFRYFYERFKNGDETAGNILIDHNRRLVKSIVLKFFTSSRCGFKELEDVGMSALFRCLYNFDLERGNKFSTVAYRYIHNEICRYLKSEKKHANQISYEQISGLDDGSQHRILYDYALYTDGFDIGKNIEKEELYKAIREIINELNPREREIVCLYFGFDCSPLTQMDIAPLFNLTQERISAIIRKQVEIIKGKLMKLGFIEMAKVNEKKKFNSKGKEIETIGEYISSGFEMKYASSGN